jgi:hypothetical protein
LTFAALPLLAEKDDDRFELKFGKDLPFRGGRVSIDHGFGELVIRTHAGNDVQVRATIRSSDEEIGKQIRIVTSEGAGGVTVRTDFPEVRNWRGRMSYSVDMTVTLPAGAPLTAKNQFGNTDARGLQTASVVENKHGSIQFRDGRGNHTLSNAFGSIEVVDNRGTLDLTNANGSISVRKVTGALTVTNRFGSIEVTDIDAGVTLSNANGSIEAMDIGGALKITNAFGSIEASSIAGPADITNSNARVALSNVTGNATVRNSKVDASGITGSVKIDTAFGGVTLRDVGGATEVTSNNGSIKAADIGGSLNAKAQFGSVQVDRVQGGASVESSNGSVTLNDITAAVRVKASFGSVFVNRAGGAVTVANANGAISVSGLRGNSCQPLSLATNFSSIKVALPENAAYTVNARTSFGRIHTDFPITTTNVSEANISGTIGRGGCKLDLVNANGNITIEKE